MQGFNCMIRHLKGKLNTVADWFSRNFRVIPEETEDICNFIENMEGYHDGMADSFLYYLHSDESDNLVRSNSGELCDMENMVEPVAGEEDAITY